MNRDSLSTVKRLLGCLKNHWQAYTAVCFLGLLVAGLEMIPPKLIGNSVDLMGERNFLFTTVLKMAGLWALITIAVQTLHGLQIYIANHAGEKIMFDLRQRVFEHLQRLTMSYFDRTHPGRIITILGGDLDAIRSVIIWGLNSLVANAAVMTFAAIMIYSIDHVLFWGTAWLVPTLTIVNFHYGRRVTAAWQVVRQHASLVGKNQAENIAGVKVVTAYNRQDHNIADYNGLQEINTLNNIKASRKSAMFQPLLQWVRFLGVGIILVFGGHRVFTGALQAGQLVSIILYWEWFMQPAINFGALFNDIIVAVSGADRVFEILDETPAIQDAPDALELPPLKGDVRFEDISFRYQAQGREILKSVSFAAPAGSTVALVGETGSGKSTIISLLARFYEPQSGRVLIDGFDLKKIKSESLHRQTAMVLQMNFLFNGTLMQNLRYARPEASDEDIYRAARILGCHERFMGLKHGYHTDVGERGAALSLGERQLACFTRALVADPKILLLDEATSALDPLTGLQVQKALQRLIKGRTTFVVTHRLSTAANSDLILVIDKGRLIESGSHHALLNHQGKYAELYRDSLSKHGASGI